jgi:hypothetical protein
VQLEEENVDEFKDTLIRIICEQSFAEDGTEEELAVQLEFDSAIRCHDPHCDGNAIPRCGEASPHLGRIPTFT